MIKVQNHGPNPLVIHGPAGAINLEVGAQFVDGQKLKTNLAVSAAARALFTRQCRMFTGQAAGVLDDLPVGPVIPITRLKPRAAKAAIKKCDKVSVLEMWRMDDARPEIQKALHERWRELVPEDAGPAGPVQYGR